MRLSASYAETVAVAVTLTMTQYRVALCPGCGKPLGWIPGATYLEVRVIGSNSDARGRGPIVKCRTCKHLCEVVSHG